jgi:hypothetical protein
VTGPETGPLVAEPRNARVCVPEAAFTLTVWPSGTVLSGNPSDGSGHANVSTATIAVPPHSTGTTKLTVAAASSLLSEMPTLLNVDSRLPLAATRIVWFSDWAAPVLSVVSVTGAE